MAVLPDYDCAVAPRPLACRVLLGTPGRIPQPLGVM
jgi:hypothetical protein